MLKYFIIGYLTIGLFVMISIIRKAKDIDSIVTNVPNINEDNIIEIMDLVYIAFILRAIKNKDLKFLNVVALCLKLLILSPIFLVKAIVNNARRN